MTFLCGVWVGSIVGFFIFAFFYGCSERSDDEGDK